MVTKKPKGLGMGLEALLGPTVKDAAQPGAALADSGVPSTLLLSDMVPGQYQPRTRMDETSAFKDAKAKAEPVSLAPSSTSPTPGQLFVLGLLLLGVVGAGVLLRRRTVVEQQHLAVVASRTLGRGKQLIVVDAGDSRLLLGVTEQGITLLSSTASHHAPRASQAPMQSPAFSLFTEEQEATMASKTGLLQDLGAKVGGLWGRPTPTPAAADWGDFDRILASTIPDTPNTDAPPTNHRRSAERKSTPVNGSGDLAELSRELQRHGARRSA